MPRLVWFICVALLGYVAQSEAAAPLFLQAITSALATIPYTGGPLSTGLVGAKLAIGTKLLYFLGFFGRKSRPKAVPKKAAAAAAAGAGFQGGQMQGGPMQAVPLPYFLSGAGRFPQMGGGGGGFGGQPFPQDPFGGMDQAQVFQALRAQGFDANTVVQIMNYGGMDGSQGGGGGFGNMAPGGGFGFPPQQGGFGNMPQGAGFGGFGNMPQGGGFGNMPQGGFGNMPQGGGFGNLPQEGGFGNLPQGGGFPSEGGFGNMQQGGGFSNVPQDFSEGDFQDPGTAQREAPASENSEGGTGDDVESFFTFLRDMDENTCISRLVCDIGNDPTFLGDFSENIFNMVSSLDVQPTSGAFAYIEIMETGRKQAGCRERFPECTDTSYEVVKNIAPSVGLPDNINIDDVNKL